MILYKADSNESKLNVLGFEYIIESKTHFIFITSINEVVHAIEVRKRFACTDDERTEIDQTLMNCYEVIAFSNDIRAIVGKKIFMIDSINNPYESNIKSI